METWLISHKIKLDYKTALTSLGVEEPEDFMDLEDEDIKEFATSNDLNKVQKRRLNKAYREIKYGKELNSPKSRSSPIQPKPASTTEVVGETKDSNDNRSSSEIDQCESPKLDSATTCKCSSLDCSSLDELNHVLMYSAAREQEDYTHCTMGPIGAERVNTYEEANGSLYFLLLQRDEFHAVL